MTFCCIQLKNPFLPWVHLTFAWMVVFMVFLFGFPYMIACLNKLFSFSYVEKYEWQNEAKKVFVKERGLEGLKRSCLGGIVLWLSVWIERLGLVPFPWLIRLFLEESWGPNFWVIWIYDILPQLWHLEVSAKWCKTDIRMHSVYGQYYAYSEF